MEKELNLRVINEQCRKEILYFPLIEKAHLCFHFLILRFFSAVFPRKIEKMVKDSNGCITRLLFCGPNFPASNKYTREYLQNYPFIQV